MTDICGHRTLKAPHPVRSAKLSKVSPSQYCGGGPRGNPRCCSSFFFSNVFASLIFGMRFPLVFSFLSLAALLVLLQATSHRLHETLPSPPGPCGTDFHYAATSMSQGHRDGIDPPQESTGRRRGGFATRWRTTSLTHGPSDGTRSTQGLQDCGRIAVTTSCSCRWSAGHRLFWTDALDSEKCQDTHAVLAQAIPVSRGASPALLDPVRLGGASSRTAKKRTWTSHIHLCTSICA